MLLYNPVKFGTATVKNKADSCKCLFDKSFVNTVAFPTPLPGKVVSHPARECRDRSFV